MSAITSIRIINPRCEPYICAVKTEHEYWVGLGSNLGNRAQNLMWAVDRLNERGTVHRQSSRYENPPEGFQSSELFQNAVVQWRTSLLPLEALALFKELENELGLRPSRPDGGYADRYLDLDLLWWSGGKFDSPELLIPHPKMLERSFVVVPLNEIEADWKKRLGVDEKIENGLMDAKMIRLGPI